MANPTFDAGGMSGGMSGGYDPDPRMGAGGLIAALVHWTGAALSLGLLGGLAVWGWQLSTRDVSEIPVIEAIQGPMRERAADPGGELALMHGLAVNRVQAEGTVAPPAERVVLAPAPLDLSEGDRLAVAALRARAAATGTAAGTDAPAAQAETGAATAAATGEGADGTAAALAEEAARLAAVRPVAGEAVAEGSPAAQAAAALAAAERIDPSVPGLSRSPRPTPRPAGLEARVAAAPAAEASATGAASAAAGPAVGREIDPASIAPGARMVQLGAFDDRATAVSEWQRLSRLHGDLMGERGFVVQQAESGGRTFFRLRMAGFADLAESRQFCTALTNRGAQCIPVSAR